MSMVMDRSTSIEEFPEIKSGGKDVSTPLLRLHVVVSYVMALLRAVVACVQAPFYFPETAAWSERNIISIF